VSINRLQAHAADRGWPLEHDPEALKMLGITREQTIPETEFDNPACLSGPVPVSAAVPYNRPNPPGEISVRPLL